MKFATSMSIIKSSASCLVVLALAFALAAPPTLHVYAARVRVARSAPPPPAFELPASFDGSQLPINYANAKVQSQREPQPLVAAEQTA